MSYSTPVPPPRGRGSPGTPPPNGAMSSLQQKTKDEEMRRMQGQFGSADRQRQQQERMLKAQEEIRKRTEESQRLAQEQLQQRESMQRQKEDEKRNKQVGNLK